MNYFLLLALLLLAPVAGAEEILFNNCMKLHANTENEPLCDRFRYQPSEEAKDYCRACKEELTFSSYCQDVGCYDKEPKNQPAEEAKPDCPEIDCGLNNPSGKMCTTDKNGCAVYVEQSDAEKCNNALKKYDDAKEGGFRVPDVMDDINTYCFRAILEEMRNR